MAYSSSARSAAVTEPWVGRTQTGRTTRNSFGTRESATAASQSFSGMIHSVGPIRTAIRYYSGLDTLSAGRHFDQILEDERSNMRLRGRR